MNTIELLNKIANGSIDSSLDAIEQLGSFKELTIIDQQEIIEFFYEFEFRKNNWHTSSIIDLLNDIAISDRQIIKKISELLVQDKRDYIVKLSILDYLFRYLNVMDDVLEKDLLSIISSKDRLIVKNQILLMLIAFSQSKEKIERYKELLIKQIRRTHDYRAHLRLYNSIMNYPEKFECFDLEYLKKIMSISDYNIESKSVKEKIKEFNLFLDQK